MASPIAHSLVGASIYLAVRPASARISRGGLIGSAALANLMDGDFLVSLIRGANFHHQMVHSLGFALAASLVVTIGVAAAGGAWRRWAWLSLLLISSHLALDTFTMDTSPPHGAMVFWPLWDRYLISPVPIFLDIWRGTPQLVFGANNLLAGLRELALGLGLLGLILAWRGPARRWAWVGISLGLLFGLGSWLASPALARRAEAQMDAYLGSVETGGGSRAVRSVSGKEAESSLMVAPTGRDRGILFSGIRGEGRDIFLLDPQGQEEPVRLTTHRGDDEMPDWSPDGRWIAFHSNRRGNWDLFVMRADGSRLRALTTHPGDDLSPSWTPDGLRIVFSSTRGESTALYSIKLDGSDVTRLTDPGQAGTDILPVVSPVDGRIALTARSPLCPRWQIHLLTPPERRPVQLTSQAGCRARWSPDGRYLAYVSQGIDGGSDIWLIQADGHGLRRLTRTPEYDYDPCWSPDGQKVVFARGRGKDKSGWDLWTIGVDGEDLQPLTLEQAGDRYPCWR